LGKHIYTGDHGKRSTDERRRKSRLAQLDAHRVQTAACTWRGPATQLRTEHHRVFGPDAPVRGTGASAVDVGPCRSDEPVTEPNLEGHRSNGARRPCRAPASFWRRPNHLHCPQAVRSCHTATRMATPPPKCPAPGFRPPHSGRDPTVGASPSSPGRGERSIRRVIDRSGGLRPLRSRTSEPDVCPQCPGVSLG
jgi:hypothetical protein